MKATIDFDDTLYRRLKVEAATRGRTIRDLVDEGVRLVLGLPAVGKADPAGAPPEAPDWFGMLGEYAPANRAHDLRSIRKSIARGRSGKGR